jgi:hypothetical protein
MLDIKYLSGRLAQVGAEQVTQVLQDEPRPMGFFRDLRSFIH